MSLKYKNFFPFIHYTQKLCTFKVILRVLESPGQFATSVKLNVEESINHSEFLSFGIANDLIFELKWSYWRVLSVRETQVLLLDLRHNLRSVLRRCLRKIAKTYPDWYWMLWTKYLLFFPLWIVKSHVRFRLPGLDFFICKYGIKIYIYYSNWELFWPNPMRTYYIVSGKLYTGLQHS